MLSRNDIFKDDVRSEGTPGIKRIQHDGVIIESNELIRVSTSFSANGNFGRYRFSGYHTYDGLLDSLCNLYPAAESICLELHRTETVPNHVVVGRLGVVGPYKSSDQRQLLIDCQQNAHLMSIIQLAEVNRELLGTRDDARYRCILSGGKPAGLFDMDFRLRCKIIGSTQIKGDVEYVNAKFSYAEEGREWTVAQLACGFGGTELPIGSMKMLRQENQITKSEIRKKENESFGKSLSIIVDGQVQDYRCREIRVFERFGEYNVANGAAFIGDAKALTASIAFDTPPLELANLLDTHFGPGGNRRPEGRSGGDRRTPMEWSRLKDATFVRVREAYRSDGGPSWEEKVLANTLYELEDPFVRIEDGDGGLVGFARESSLIGWVPLNAKNEGGTIVQVMQPSERERTAILLGSWWLAIECSRTIDANVVKEVGRAISSLDLDATIIDHYSDAERTNMPLYQGVLGIFMPESCDEFERLTRSDFWSAKARASKSNTAWTLVAYRIRKHLADIDEPDDIKSRVRRIITTQVEQPERPAVLSTIQRGLRKGRGSIPQLDGLTLSSSALCTLACLGHRKATGLVCNLLIETIKSETDLMEQSSPRPSELPRAKASAEDNIPEWARPERAYLLQWADDAIAKHAEGIEGTIAAFLSRQLGKGCVSVLTFDDDHYQVVTDAEMPDYPSEVTSFPFPLAVIRTPDEGDVYGILVFRWNDLAQHKDGYGVAYVRDGGKISMGASPLLTAKACRLVTYLDCDNAIVDTVYIDQAETEGRAVPEYRTDKEMRAEEYVLASDLKVGTRVIVEREHVTPRANNDTVRRAHFRRGFTKRQRVGPKNDWHYETRWIKPTFVHGSHMAISERRVRRIVL